MEILANEVALDNRPVTTKIYEREEDLAGVPLRKHTEGLEAPIRVVTIENSDSCTCCAPHVKTTGEIGLIKITQRTAWKGGTRITFLCGERALKYTEEQQRLVRALCLKFSTGSETLFATVEKIGAELEKEKKLNRAMADRLQEYYKEELQKKAVAVKSISLITEVAETDSRQLRPLALSTLTEKAVTLLFARDGEKTGYVLVSKGIKENMGEWLQAVNAATGGKGGGRGDMAQGSCAGAVSPETVAQLKNYLILRLKNI